MTLSPAGRRKREGRPRRENGRGEQVGQQSRLASGSEGPERRAVEMVTELSPGQVEGEVQEGRDRG